jgi:hypothetical protein
MVKTESTQVLKEGAGAPQFELKGTDNKIYSLEMFGKSEALLDLFAITVPMSRLESMT